MKTFTKFVRLIDFNALYESFIEYIHAVTWLVSTT